ncbi:polysaccharide deacetylase family protein [Candidatus Spongiisocius sp.]|uniref:polysaccharide deacetylase family protein n=1 Tax=Candidatus Spongiisocius sp. TaxID=3101273 RepID=UPI003B5B1B95
MRRGGGWARRVATGLVLAGLVGGCSTGAPPAAVPDTPSTSEPAVPSTRPADPEPAAASSPPTTATAAVTEPAEVEAEPPAPEPVVEEPEEAVEPEAAQPEGEPVTADPAVPVEPDAEPEVEMVPEETEPVVEESPATATSDTPEPEDPVATPVPTGRIIEFPHGENLITIPGTVGPGDRQAYVIEAVADIRYTFTLGAPTGVWLDAGLGEDVSGLPGERPRRAALVLPANMTWLLEVVSTAEEPADFEITATVRSLDRGPVPPGPVVYLTFDDGPHPVHTTEVLDVLRRYGVRATFFVVGAMVQRFPHLLNRVLLEGHTVANHTWNHENLAKLSGEAIDRTLERTQDILGANATACMRPPYGALDDLVRQRSEERGLDVIMWSASANDWLDLTAEMIAERIVAGSVDGGIILMHDGGGDRSRTVQGLDIALQQLSGQGIRFEPICAR